MKILKGSPIFNTSLFEVMIMNGFLIFLFIKLHFDLYFFFAFFLIMNIFILIKESGKMHYFIYDKKEIFIKNSWNPYIERKIYFDELEDVKSEYRSYSGIEITFYHKNGSKSKYNVINISNKKIEEMIDEIKENLL